MAPVGIRHAPIVLVLVLLLVAAVPPTLASPLAIFDDDAGSGGDAGDGPGSALPIEKGTHTGTLTTLIDQEDWYAFEIDADSAFEISTTSGDVIVEAAMPTGWWLNPVPGYPARWLAPEPGTVLIAIWGGSGSTSYDFTIDAFPMPQDDAGSGADAVYETFDWLPISSGNHSGDMNAYDPVDPYVIDIVGAKRVTATFTTSADPSTIEFIIGSFYCCVFEYAFGEATMTLSAVFENETAIVFVDHEYNAWQEGTIDDTPYTLDITIEAADGSGGGSEPGPASDYAITSFEEIRTGWDPIPGFGADDGLPPEVHERHYLVLDVTNEGDGTAEFAEAFFYERGDGLVTRGRYFAAIELPSLAPGESTSVMVEWPAAQKLGSYTIHVEVHIWGDTPEEDWSDNRASLDTYARIQDSPVAP